MSDKNKNSSSEKEDIGAESSIETDGPSDEMSAEEQDAFNKIMGEIEGSGDSEPSADQDAAEADDGTVSEEDFAAELEKVVQQAGDDNTDSAAVETDNEDGEEDLDEDQQKAFESIMSQIEGTDSEEKPDEETTEADDATVSEEDFAAELEKVVQQAGDDNNDSAAAGSNSEVGEGDLDEDQQKAFEGIMSQIEGAGSDPGADENDIEKDEGSSAEEIPSAKPENAAHEAEGDAADESEPPKVMVESAGSEKQEEEKDDADSDDSLDKDQQEAFESIMAQIEGGKSEEEEADGELEVAEEPQSEAKATVAQTPDADPSENSAEEAKEETPAEIDEILKEVAVEEDEEESSPPESTTVETASQSSANGADGQIVTDGEKEVPDPDDTAPESRKTESIPADQTADTKQVDVVPEPQADIKFKPLPRADTAADATEKKAAVPREASKPSKKRWKRIVLGASAVVLLFVGLAGYRYWPRQPATEGEPKAVSSESAAQETAAQPETTPASQPQEPVPQDQHASDRSRLKTAGENLDRLRNRLLSKKAEIEELRTYYQAGIDAEINGIIELLETKNKKSAAMADPRIALGLSAIQRRDTYIRKLVAPVDELTWHSEELLYFSRKAELLELMAAKTSDIDIDGFVRQSRERIEKHSRAMADLNIDDVPVSPLSTEAIWNDITRRLPEKSSKAGRAEPKTDNDLISEQICNGNYSQKLKLTVLTPKTARCLAQWKGKDLFLNELKVLKPEAARQLAAWKGEWLGLNGLEELSPEAAAYLSRWKGKGLSLNGLSRLSPRVVANLSEWQGDQIELVNVKHMAHWENPKTRLLLSEEMNRKRRAGKE